jgi:hypothetical protein
MAPVGAVFRRNNLGFLTAEAGMLKLSFGTEKIVLSDRGHVLSMFEKCINHVSYSSLLFVNVAN